MYNFQISTLPEHSSDSFVLDEHVEVSGHAIRYLKKFQLSAVRFLYNHLKNREFCILNDERGLGKTATSSVLFGITATQKNCFIVVENNDDRVIDWQFHLDVLTDLNVKVLNEEKDYNETIDSIYIVKWNTLRLIEDLSKWRIDMVVVDNREQLLNNAFCISTLLRNFEKKIQLVISGIDITSDVKLLFNILRLGGRLERQLETFKEFDKKFHLPDENAISNKISDLEEYFRKREMMKDYCRDYRLRRYCYQYENLLPLVDPQRYRAHLLHWKGTKRGNTNTASIIISESISTVISTEDLLGKLNSQENHIETLEQTTKSNININSMMINQEKCVQLDMDNTRNDANDEDANMSPLIYNSESDSEQEIVLLSGNSIESVIPVVEVNDDDDDVQIVEEIAPNKSKVQDDEIRKEYRKFSVQNTVKESKKTSKKSKEQTAKTPQDKCLASVQPDGMEIITTDEVALTSKSDMAINSEKPKAKKSTKEEKMQESYSSTETFIESDQDISAGTYKKDLIKDENNDGRNAKSVRKSSMKTLSGIHHRETRNMIRTTRSSGRKCFALEFEPDKKPKTKITSQKKNSRPMKVTAKAKTAIESKSLRDPEVEKKKSENQKPKSSSDHPISQNLLPPPSSDSEEIQCGQRLNIESSGENGTQAIKENSNNTFLFPTMPPSLSILPITSLVENDSDVMLISDNNEKIVEAISLLSCSNDDQKTIRRTRKGQGKKNPSKKNLNNLSKVQKIDTTNSPDLFSFGSDNRINTIPFTQVHCPISIPTTSISKDTFGFKIFGSEVRRPTENITKSNKSFEKQSEANQNHSCLNMLDQMCEKVNEASSSNGIKYALRKQKLSNVPTDRRPSFNESSNLFVASDKRNTKERNRNQHSIYTEMPMPSHTPIQPIQLLTDEIFEITNNATFGSTLRINATGDISPVHQLNSSQHQHHNKITNYLIGSGNAKQNSITDDDAQSFGTPSKRTANIQQSNNATLPCTRKSPKSLKSTQTTKLTKWFRRSFLDDTTQQQQQQQQQPMKESAETSTFSKKTKRRRLDLLFNS